MLAAVRQNWDALEYASEGLKSNPDFMKRARRYNWEPLYKAVEDGDIEKVAALLKCEDINVNAASPNAVTALYLACQKGCIKIVQLIINSNKLDENGIDAVDITGHTPLLVSCLSPATQGNPLLFKYLLYKGANIKHKNHAGLTALDIAFSNHHGEMNEDAIRELLNYAKDKHLLVTDIMSDTSKQKAVKWANENKDESGLLLAYLRGKPTLSENQNNFLNNTLLKGYRGEPCATPIGFKL